MGKGGASKSAIVPAVLSMIVGPLLRSRESMSFPETRGTCPRGILWISFRVPITRNLVLSGLISKWFSQHQLATLWRSASSFMVAVANRSAASAAFLPTEEKN